MKNKDFKKQDYVLLAKLAQQTQRYQDMMNFADQILHSEDQLTPAQRNLCASAYKNVVATRRAELKVIQAMSAKAKHDDGMRQDLEVYQRQIQNQLNGTCLRIIKILQGWVIQNKHHIKGAQAIVFFKKMLADFKRYLCQFAQNTLVQKQYIEQAGSLYGQAQQIARSNLPQTNPVRLSLHLNMSVFLWEIQEERQAALELANRAFEEAIANIDTVNQENYKECTMILQLIRDNINLWSGEE